MGWTYRKKGKKAGHDRRKPKAKRDSDKTIVVRGPNEEQKKHDRRKLKTKEAARKPVSVSHPSDAPETPSYAIHRVGIDLIKVVGERRRVNPEKLEELKDSIAKLGLRTPLAVRPLLAERHLVAGLHRLEAVRSLGWKKVPCVFIKDKRVARIWEISENLHRAELTTLEEADLIAEWLKLTEAETLTSAEEEEEEERKPGRPKGRMTDAAAKLPGTGTEAAKRKRIERAAKIAGIDSEVKQEIVEAGFDKSQAKLLAIAAGGKDKAAQREKLKQLKAGRRKPEQDAAGDADDDEPALETLKREWKPSKQWQRAWAQASKAERRQFVSEVMGISFGD